MQSNMRRVPMRACLASLLLYTTLSACATHIEVSPIAQGCSRLLKASGLLEPTAGAARPANDSGGEIAAFGDRQTGQLDKSNADKKGAQAICEEYEKLQQEAVDHARKKLRGGLIHRIFSETEPRWVAPRLEPSRYATG
jgi:hypothetical protein